MSSIQTSPEFEGLLTRARSMGAITAAQADGYRVSFAEGSPSAVSRQVQQRITDTEDFLRPANATAAAARAAGARASALRAAANAPDASERSLDRVLRLGGRP